MAANASPLQLAVGQVQRLGSYAYDARLQATITPHARLEYAGQGGRRQDLAIRGAVNLRGETLQLTIFGGDGGAARAGDALELRIAGGVAQRRVGAGVWQPVELPAGAFAPGNDVLSFLAAARVTAGPERVQLGGVELLRYRFAIDGPVFAAQLRAQLERAARQSNRLPPGASLPLVDAYLRAEGSGELLVDAAGLPRRQVISLTIPDQLRGETLAGTITVDFSGYPPAPVAPLPWLAGSWGALLGGTGLLAAGAMLVAALLRARASRPAYNALTALVVARWSGARRPPRRTPPARRCAWPRCVKVMRGWGGGAPPPHPRGRTRGTSPIYTLDRDAILRRHAATSPGRVAAAHRGPQHGVGRRESANG